MSAETLIFLFAGCWFLFCGCLFVLAVIGFPTVKPLPGYESESQDPAIIHFPSDVTGDHRQVSQKRQ